jgi:hypothetical protein
VDFIGANQTGWGSVWIGDNVDSRGEGHMRGISIKALSAAGLASLVCAGGAYASTVGLPASGGQVSNDPPAIDPSQSAGLVDLTSGSLVAGNPRVPWATFSQLNADGSQQIFVRAFKHGVWQTEGFPESLNEDSTQVAQAPSIDFTGPNRTVPWVAWADPSTALGGVSEIFASRFVTQPAPAQNGGQWIHEGQEISGTAPSLNINTNRDAADPSLFGGTTNAGGNPAPWITWQEADNGTTASPAGSPKSPKNPNNSTFQIFVSHAVPATAGACPAGTKPAHGNSVGNFCFQQVGIDRVKGPGVATDPSLNVDPTRDGIQGDIAFTGANDTVPWVVWYENSDNGTVTDGLLNADMVFAARGVADASGDGGFHWQVVGLGTARKSASQDILTNGAGDCASSQAAEQACSLNANAATGLTDGNGAENPTVAAGTMVPGNPTTPWVAWDESSSNGGLHSVFVARLTGGDHFTLLNNGQPISHSGLDSTRPDIVFSHDTPYVSWHETAAGTTTTFVGHFEGNPANPVFHIDTPTGVPTTRPVASDDDVTDVRAPLASTCPADPFTQDGNACQGGNVGTPFFAYTNTTSGPRALFSQAYTPVNPQTGSATEVGVGTATVNGSVDLDGAPVEVRFDFGPTTNYGSSTPSQLLLPSETQTSVSAALAGLPAGTAIHYRLVAQTDFGTVDGTDQVVQIPAPVAESRITAPRGNVKARNLKAITGTATATLGVAKVIVAVIESSRGAHLATQSPRPSCRQLGSDGRLHKLRIGRQTRCTPTTFLRASGTTHWILRLRKRLPKGTYVAISVAIDSAGHAERIGSSDKSAFRVS